MNKSERDEMRKWCRNVELTGLGLLPASGIVDKLRKVLDDYEVLEKERDEWKTYIMDMIHILENSRICNLCKHKGSQVIPGQPYPCRLCSATIGEGFEFNMLGMPPMEITEELND